MTQTLPTPTIEPELVLVKKRLVEVKRAKIAAIKRDGLPFYRPHPKQELFHRSTAKRRGAFTGNRFGKSTMGCAEDCAWLRGERVWMAADDPGRRAAIPQRPVKGLIIANDWDKVKEIWTGDEGKIWRFLPKDLIVKSTRNHSGAIDTLIVKSPFGGLSSLRFDTVQSFKSNPLGTESSDWDFIHVDEPCPEPMFKAAARGLIDRGGFAWFTITAIAEPWITDAFAPKGVFYPICFKIEGSIFDNIYLTKENINDYSNTLTEDEQSCRLYGKPAHLSGLVYKEFQWDKHVLQEVPKGWTAFDDPPSSWPIYFQVDPHPRVPICVLFVTVDPFGRRIYYKDIFIHDSIELVASFITTHLKNRFVIRGRADPMAFIQDDLMKKPTMASEFSKFGVELEKAVKALAHGILHVQGELKKKDTTILFTPTAKRTLWEIQRYHWKEGEDVPVDKDDHAMECLYRAELDEPRWIERQRSNFTFTDEVIDKPRFDLADIAIGN